MKIQKILEQVHWSSSKLVLFQVALDSTKNNIVFSHLTIEALVAIVVINHLQSTLCCYLFKAFLSSKYVIWRYLYASESENSSWNYFLVTIWLNIQSFYNKGMQNIVYIILLFSSVLLNVAMNVFTFFRASKIIE